MPCIEVSVRNLFHRVVQYGLLFLAFVINLTGYFQSRNTLVEIVLEKRRARPIRR